MWSSWESYWFETLRNLIIAKVFNHYMVVATKYWPICKKYLLNKILEGPMELTSTKDFLTHIKGKLIINLLRDFLSHLKIYIKSIFNFYRYLINCRYLISKHTRCEYMDRSLKLEMFTFILGNDTVLMWKTFYSCCWRIKTTKRVVSWPTPPIFNFKTKNTLTLFFHTSPLFSIRFPWDYSYQKLGLWHWVRNHSIE